MPTWLYADNETWRRFRGVAEPEGRQVNPRLKAGRGLPRSPASAWQSFRGLG
ncbi:MAG: hypothetical protein ACXVDF_22900 [Ktedonobacterales bacterium]